MPFYLFHCVNYKKIFKSRSRVFRTQHFPVHDNPFTPNKIFFAKITMPYGLFHGAKLQKKKKKLKVDPEL